MAHADHGLTHVNDLKRLLGDNREDGIRHLLLYEKS